MQKINNNSKINSETEKLYFLNNINSKIIEELIIMLKSDEIKNNYKNVIIGGSNDNNNNKSVDKLIQMDNKNILKRVLLKSDYIILDLNSSNLDDIEYSINILKYYDFKEEKKLILISNILTWADTKYKPKVEEGEEDEFKSENDEEEQNEENNEESKKINLKEKDFYYRIPQNKYNRFKELETLCLSSGKQKRNLKTFIVCPGIYYGNGEWNLFEIFQHAWLNKPQELQYIGKGNNYLPLIHIKDLILHIKKIIYNEIDVNYILAIDHSLSRTQKKIIKSISNGLGTNLIKSVDFEECIYSENLKNLLSLDLKFKFSSIFNPKDEDEEEEVKEDEDEENDSNNGEIKKKKIKITFNWHSKEGLPKNINMIKNEFIKYQDLKSNKIFIYGPPCSGKTYFSNIISEYFNIPHIKLNEVIDLYKNKEEDELAEEIKANLEESKENLINEARELLEKKKLKKIKNLPEDIDENKIIPKINDELITKILIKRLNENDCISRGYVLDGIIKNYKFADNLFNKLKLNDDGEEIEDEKELNKTIIPNSIIFLKANTDYLKNIILNTTEKNYTNHLNIENFYNRMKIWENINNENTGEDILIDFFKENNFDIFSLDLNNNFLDKFSSIKSFIERNGKFKNYIDNETLKEKTRKEKETELIKNKESSKNKIIQDQEKREKIIRKLQKEEIRLKKKKEREIDNQIINKKSEFLKNYMETNVVPILKKGIEELSKKTPDDPIDFLAEFLFENALNLNNENKGDI